MRERTAYFLPFFAAFLRAPFFAPFLAPPFLAAFFAPFLAAFFAPFFFAAMVISIKGVNRSNDPPVVRTSQWVDAEAFSHRGTISWRDRDIMRRLSAWRRSSFYVEVLHRTR